MSASGQRNRLPNAINIGGRKVGPGEPCFIIAEAGVNHNGDVELAKRLVDVAADAGADAVKFQTFKAERLVTASAPKATYQLDTTDAAESQFEMIRSLELSPEAHRELRKRCEHRGMIFMSTPFDQESADFLDGLGVPAFKIGSGEVTNLPLLEHIAHKGKPVILSTGMSDLSEVQRAVNTIKGTGNQELIVLHCVSNYPADPADVNLRAMATMENALGTPVGYSDHTLGIEIPIAAAALGACVIEKHFTIDRTLSGPDHRASLEPPELAAMVKGIRTVESALGSGVKEAVASETNTREVARRSLVANQDLAPGTILTREMLIALRPGTGIPPAELERVVGRRVGRAVSSGHLLSWQDLE